MKVQTIHDRQLLRHTSTFRRQLVKTVVGHFDLEGCRRRLNQSRLPKDLLINFLQDPSISKTELEAIKHRKFV